MKITYDDFVHHCPASQTPDTTVFDAISAQLDKWQGRARELASPEIYDSLDTLDSNPIGENYDRLVALRRELMGMVCHLAFWDAIPQLDLVLTPTGFGVVSNDNVAPASADRVAALRKQLRRLGLAHVEEAVDILRELDGPLKSERCAQFFRTLFWRASHLHLFGVINPTLDDLAEKMPQILTAQTLLSAVISPELLTVLLRAEGTASASPVQSILINMCRVLCVYAAGADFKLFEKQRLAILGFMEENQEELPEYRDSATYKANHFQRYENKADDPCFFFG